MRRRRADGTCGASWWSWWNARAARIADRVNARARAARTSHGGARCGTRPAQIGADMEPALQVKILRALESGEILPVGATKPTVVDARLVSATNQPLPARIAEGRFRDDLYWRVRGIEIALPRLADRAGDLALLAQHFLNQARALVPGSAAAKLSAAALRRLEAHAWPGNLRELRHEMQRALVMSGGRAEILEEDLSPSLTDGARPAAEGGLDEKVAALEQAEIVAALAATGGNRSQAAQRLGLSRQGLANKIARYRL